MKSQGRWQTLCSLTVGLLLAGLTGCQTWVGGMTLPSPHYMEHPPQYFPPTPPFPLPRELASMEAQAAIAAPAGPVPGAPAPPVPAPGP